MVREVCVCVCVYVCVCVHVCMHGQLIRTYTSDHINMTNFLSQLVHPAARKSSPPPERCPPQATDIRGGAKLGEGRRKILYQMVREVCVCVCMCVYVCMHGQLIRTYTSDHINMTNFLSQLVHPAARKSSPPPERCPPQATDIWGRRSDWGRGDKKFYVRW